MYIARLQLKNFKSFGGYHELKLDSGFTAIVGPNGSGKSNILDALRWGLGDGSGSRLRITRQSDLLFQGTATLVGAKSAEVALDLKEEERSAVIRRKYSSESGASILVDGLKIRLQDLSEVKRRWRLAGDRFAFIGQGDITSAITQRPMERRTHLEELFGIDLYRKRRDQALSRMTSAEDELKRLYTLMAELKARREEIAPDVKTALRAKTIEDDLERARSSFYHHRRYVLQQNIDQLGLKIKDTRIDLEEKQGWKIIWEKALFQMKEQSAGTEKVQIELKESLGEVESQLESCRRSSFELETSLRLEGEQFGRIEENSRSLREREEELTEQIRVFEGNVSSFRENFNAKSEEKASLEKTCLEMADRAEKLRKKRSALISKKETLSESIETLKARKEALNSGDAKRQQMEKSLKDELSDLKNKIEIAKSEGVEIRNKYDETRVEYDRINDRCRDLALRIQPLRKDLYRLETEQEHLANSSSQGFYPSAVNHIISASELGKITVRPTPVVEAFDCPTEYSVAMESYLGGRQFWLLVESMTDAREGINELKRHKAGRVTYLPLERTRPRRPKEGVIIPEKGVVGWAIDLMTSSEVWTSALQHLFGDLLIVEDYDTATSMVNGGYRFPIVTLDGEVFSPGGTISGGKTRRSGGALQARSKLRKVEEQFSLVKIELRKLEKSLKKAESQEADLGIKVEEQRSLLSESESALARLEKIQSDRDRDMKFVLSERDASKDKLRKLDDEVISFKAELSQVSEELDSFICEEHEDSQPRLMELKSQVILSQERLASVEENLKRTRKELSDTVQRSKRTSSELLQFKKRQDDNQIKLREFQNRAEVLSCKRTNLMEDIGSATTGNEKLSRALDRCLARYRIAEDKSTDSENKLSWLIQKKEGESAKLTDLISSWEETYPYPEECYSPSGTPEEKERKVKSLERSVRSLGRYNMGALSEDQSLQERVLFYEEQSTDVISGIEELKALIEETDSQAGNLFRDALGKIDIRFNGLFQRLFGGGEAHLRLQEGIGLWEAGVEIVARPPGKVFAYLTQLSGGEQTLTALSLLFASMEVAKVPLVVLDEVDAALDEVNLRRFADVAVDYSTNVQIIAMTHRRQTMERAGIMYGVTMSEPGLSQVIGVKLEDWC